MNIGFSDFNFLGIFEGFVASGILQNLHPELWSKTLLRIARSVKTSGVGLLVTGIGNEKSQKRDARLLRRAAFPSSLASI